MSHKLLPKKHHSKIQYPRESKTYVSRPFPPWQRTNIMSKPPPPTIVFCAYLITTWGTWKLCWHGWIVRGSLKKIYVGKPLKCHPRIEVTSPEELFIQHQKESQIFLKYAESSEHPLWQEFRFKTFIRIRKHKHIPTNFPLFPKIFQKPKSPLNLNEGISPHFIIHSSRTKVFRTPNISCIPRLDVITTTFIFYLLYHISTSRLTVENKEIARLCCSKILLPFRAPRNKTVLNFFFIPFLGQSLR